MEDFSIRQNSYNVQNLNLFYLFAIRFKFMLPVLQPDLGNARPPFTLNVLLVPLILLEVDIEMNKEYTFRCDERRKSWL